MIRPLGNRLVIEPIKEDARTTTAAGLIIEDQEFKVPQSLKATVVAVGPGVADIAPGDVVMVSQFAPTQVKEKPGDKTLMVPAEDVLAVVVPDKVA